MISIKAESALALLSLAANAASVVGFFVTVWVLIDLKRIKSLYLFKARIPELALKLGEHATSLSALLGAQADSRHQIEMEIGEIEVLLISIRDKTRGRVRASAKSLLSASRKPKIAADENALRRVYVCLKKLELEINELLQDLKWEC